jgi:hypothetical protein
MKERVKIGEWAKNWIVSALKKKIRIEDLLYSYSGSHQTSQSVTSSLMNLVMQFRKVSIVIQLMWSWILSQL